MPRIAGHAVRTRLTSAGSDDSTDISRILRVVLIYSTNASAAATLSTRTTGTIRPRIAK